ncbi:MAG: outer membrane lipoprotein carrier protein LolA, partial [Bdellovibrionia bacterium]
DTSPSQSKQKPKSKKAEKKEAALKKSAPKKSYDEDLGETEKRYAAAKSVKMAVKKSLILSVLERTDVYDGLFFLSGTEKLRLEFEKPVKSVAVVNGKDFWVIEYPPEDVDDKVRVLKSTLGEKSQSQILVTSLMGRGRILDHFAVESKKKKDGKIVFKMKATGDNSEIKNLELVLSEGDRLINEINYEDELENKTKFEFSNIEFDSDVPDKLFKYSPPKGAEINQL